jgi:hypothetical protein
MHNFAILAKDHQSSLRCGIDYGMMVGSSGEAEKWRGND